MSKYVVSSSPHIANDRTVMTIMIDVLIALVPAVVGSIYFFGFYSWFLVILSVGSAIGSEALFNLITKREQTIGDCSAPITGVLLALNLPVTVPFYVPIIGSAFAIIFVKMLFGGIGKNFANPAIAGRIFLLLAWASAMTSFVKPITWHGDAFLYFRCILKGKEGLLDVAALTTATPLASLTTNVGSINVFDLFFGAVGGSLGETSALLILVGGVYLIVRRVIDWRVPVTFIGTVAVFALIYGAAKGQGASYVLPSIFGGGLFLGAFFMATDYATTPNTKLGLVVFAFGCGLLTSLIRFYGNYPEGVSFAILLMNIVTPYIDKVCKPRTFGFQPKKGAKA